MSLFSRLGVRGNRSPIGVSLNPFPEICAKGAVRSSVLVLVVDMMAGFMAEADAGDDWVFTTDLSLRAPARYVPDQVGCVGTTLRAGRGSISCGVEILDGEVPYAYGVAGFVRIPRRHGDPPKPHLHADFEVPEDTPIDRFIDEEVGIEVVDAATGHVRVELTKQLLNPAGAMQGAMVSLLAEVAAETLAQQSRDVPQVVTDLDIRYLAMGREGPVESTAAWVGHPSTGAIRVELRDRGNGDRLVTSVLARTSDAPG